MKFILRRVQSRLKDNQLQIYVNPIIHEVKCGHPLDLPVNNFTSVSGYSDPALVGVTVNISCLLGNVIQESNTTVATCIENGEWEPDPSREMRCRGIIP